MAPWARQDRTRNNKSSVCAPSVGDMDMSDGAAAPGGRYGSTRRASCSSVHPFARMAANAAAASSGVAWGSVRSIHDETRGDDPQRDRAAKVA